MLIKRSQGPISFPLKSLSSKYFRKIVIGQSLASPIVISKLGLAADITSDIFVVIPPEFPATEVSVYGGSLTYTALDKFLGELSATRNVSYKYDL